jgi:2-polyprenyl-3-methyl-5-hydroxy-6-metoxy-1,4-benzoquinol methylase
MRKIIRLHSTVDPRDQARFDLLRGWWHQDSSMALLYQYNYRRVETIRRHCPSLAESQALDVGCGAGMLA